jgi:hypothetical protein
LVPQSADRDREHGQKVRDLLHDLGPSVSCVGILPNSDSGRISIRAQSELKPNQNPDRMLIRLKPESMLDPGSD